MSYMKASNAFKYFCEDDFKLYVKPVNKINIFDFSTTGQIGLKQGGKM